MEDPLRAEKIRSWVEDFLADGGIDRFARPVRRCAADALVRFLHFAAAEGVAPEDAGVDDLRRALLATAGTLSESERRQWPEACAAFLRWCGDHGCLPRGRAFAAKLAGLAAPGAAKPATTHVSRPAPSAPPPLRDDDPEDDPPLPRSQRRLGPNARCPCGSGRKAKHCCYRVN